MTNDDMAYSSRAIYKALWRAGAPKELADRVLFELSNVPAEAAVVTPSPSSGRSVLNRGAVALYYLGGFLIIAAMSLFLGSGWASYGAGIGALILIGYLAALVFATETLKRRGHVIPAGLVATAVAALLPGLAFALFQSMGWSTDNEYGRYEDFYDYVSAQWVWLELVGIAGSLIVLRWVNFSAVLSVLGLSLWFAGMDFASALFGDAINETGYALVALVFGLVGVGIGLAYDARGLRRHAFWPHLFGLLSVVGAWEYLWDFDLASPWTAIGMSALCGAMLVAFGTLIMRRVYLTFGGVPLYGALSWATFDVADSALVSAPVIALLGAALIWAGVRWQHVSAEWREDALAKMPAWLRVPATAQDTVFTGAMDAHR